jgi:excisionase family DNA binding protein
MTTQGTDGKQLNRRKLMKLKEASQYMSMFTWSIRRLIQNGEIPVVQTQPGAPFLVDPADMDKYVERSKRNMLP